MSPANPGTVLVTGGAGGLGLEIATALARREGRCVVFDRSKERIAQLPGSIEGHHLDVTDEAQVVAGVTRVISAHGPIAVLVNNAGTIFSRPLLNLTNVQRRHDYQAFRANIDINLNSVFLVGSVVAESMVLNRVSGVIVNISSVSARGNAGQSAYSAAKAGVEALTRVWSAELGPFGIRVIAVAPGFMDTPSTRDALSKQRLDELARKVPLRRLGTPANVVEAVLFAIDCNYMTGTTIEVNGGVSL